MREENQLNVICRIIERYRLNIPLNRHLKEFFKAHPQMGSNDRRLASAFVYNYFRIGKMVSDLRMIERLTVANFLCSVQAGPLLGYCLEKFSLLKTEDVPRSPEEKMLELKKHYPSFNPEKLFPFSSHLSSNIQREKFIESFFHQPKLWIRIRREYMEAVMNELKAKNILFEANKENPQSVALINSTSLEKTESFINGYFEIQDWSSQQTLNFIHPKPNELWWDACAGSGGKSLMIADAEPSVSILASDSRSSILKNLEERFRKAGMRNFKTEMLDLSTVDRRPSTVDKLISENPGNAILADVPCTGSGTWSRTPEWLTMFSEDSIAQFVTLQRNIIRNLSAYLKTGNAFVYITCSVFKEENEDNVDWILSNTKLSLQKSGYIEGESNNADTMFAARFIL